MAKPTPRQLKVIELLRAQCTYWAESNDIHSPSHGPDIDSELVVLVLDDAIIEKEHNVLGPAIKQVWDTISGLDPCPHRAAQGQQLLEELGVAAALHLRSETAAGPSAVSPSKTREDAATVPNAITQRPVLGYFTKNGSRWNLVEVDGDQLLGYEINCMGKVLIARTARSAVHELVLLHP